MFTVRVIRQENGKASQGERVYVHFDGFLGGGGTTDELTDEKGDAHFEYDPGRGEVFVNGSSVYKGDIEGRVVVYV